MKNTTPNFPRDFSDLLGCLKKAKCKYVVVGSHAMAAWGYVRATGDLDILILPTQANANRVYDALKEFGAPLKTIAPIDFSTPGTVYQIGLPPVRIDILNQIDGVDAVEAYSKARYGQITGVRVRILSLDHLIHNKKSTGRDKDRLDANELQKLKRRKSGQSKSH